MNTQQVYYLAQITVKIGWFKYATRHAIMLGNTVVHAYDTFQESREVFEKFYSQGYRVLREEHYQQVD